MKKTYFLLSLLGAAVCPQAFAAPLVVDGVERTINVPSGTVAQPSDSPISAVNGGHLVLNVQAGQLNMLPSAEPGYVALGVSGQSADGTASSMELYSAQSFFLNGYKTPDTYTGISVQDGGSMTISTKQNYNLNTGSTVTVGAGSTLTFKGQGSYTTANMLDTHIDNGGTVTFKLNGNGGWATGIGGASSVVNRAGAVFEADGLLVSGGSSFVNDGTVTGHKVIVQDVGTVFTNNGALSNNSTQFSVTYGGKLVNNAGGTVTENTFSGGLTMYANEQLAAEVENHGTLTLNYGGTLNGTNAVLTNAEGGVLELKNSKTLTLGKNASTDSVKLVNEGTLKMGFGASVVVNGNSLLDNSGTMDATSGKIVLNDSARLVTGNLSVGNRAEGQDANAALDYTFADGLKGVTVQVNSGTGVAEVGTHIVSANESKQFITGDDLKQINGLVLSDLKLNSVSPDRLKVVNILRESVEAAATAKDFTDGTITTVVNGATLTVEKGEEPAVAGTIGSVTADGFGSSADIRLDSDTTETNTLVWKGDSLKTLAKEKTLISKTSSVTIGATGEGASEQLGTGTLVVSADSELTVQGEVNAKVNVEQGGTLKGSGSMGAADVQGTLVVGNSPGAPTFAGDLTLYGGSETVFSIAGLDTPATATLNGWESGAYSQITITDGGILTLESGACFTIEFGGDVLAEIGGCQDFTFDVTLVKAGEGSITLGDIELAQLLDNTDFLISPDALAGGAGWSLEYDRNNLAYSVQDNGSTLHLAGKARLVPEPATATLSLLALAALAARRRRR